MRPYLSVIIPCYKEEERIKKTFPAFDRFARIQKYPVELIFIDDGSPDKTREVIEELIAGKPYCRLIYYKQNKGKGYGVMRGMLEARGEYRLFADADNATSIEQANKLLKYAEDYPVVIGSRYLAGFHQKRKQSFVRILGSRALNVGARLFTGLKITDSQCGFKLFADYVVEEIFKRQTFTRFSFDIEILAIADMLGYKIKEVPIDWYDDPHSTVHPIRDGFRFLWALILIVWNKWRRIYKSKDHRLLKV